MQELTFVTGNTEKYLIAADTFARQDIKLAHARLDFDEIQAEDGDPIILDKVRKAFAQLQAPVVVNDDCWHILGLNGFPGPYMKSVAHWFTPEDFLNLTLPLKNRRVILAQRIAYKSADTEHAIVIEHEGELLKELRGEYGNSWQKIITMPGDNGKSVAEAYDQGVSPDSREVSGGWLTFIDWYKLYKEKDMQ